MKKYSNDLQARVASLYYKVLEFERSLLLSNTHSYKPITTDTQLRMLIDDEVGPRIHDVFLRVLPYNHIEITLILEDKNWHWKHTVSSMVLDMLYNYSLNGMHYSLDCRNKDRWDLKFESILKTYRQNPYDPHFPTNPTMLYYSKNDMLDAVAYYINSTLR